jgi:hypothetical protein
LSQTKAQKKYQAQYHVTHREERNARAREYSRTHKEDDHLRGKRYRAAHPERNLARVKKWRLAHPESARAAWRRHADKISAIIAAAKDHPCADCTHIFPKVVMDFDHVRGEKKFNIGQEAFSRSRKDLLTEIAKCDIVCANCHRIRTAERKAGRRI